ncbi:MAG: CHAT domain-containing protein [Candidatus Eiseniibacteriota bacterium]
MIRTLLSEPEPALAPEPARASEPAGAAELTRARPSTTDVPGFEEALALGAQLSELGQSDRRRALELAERFVARTSRGAPAAVRAVARRARAHALRGHHRFAAALRDYEAALRDFAIARLPIERARTVIGMCDVLANLGRSKEALAHARSARRTLRAAGEWRRLARLEVNIANLHLRQDRQSQALAHYRAAEGWFEQAGHELDLALARFNLANLLVERGQLREAHPYLASSAELLERQGAHRQLLLCRLLEADASARLGRVGEALRKLEAARESADALSDAALQAAAAAAGGRLCHSVGRHAEAGPLFDRAVGLFAEATMRWDHAETLVARSRWHRDAGDSGAAAADLAAAAALFEGLGQRSRAWWTHVERLRLHGPRRFDEAEHAMLRRAIGVFQRAGHGLYEAEARLLFAEELRITRRPGARRQLARVSALLKRHPDPWLGQRWVVESVVAGVVSGRAAFRRLERAASIAEILRTRIPTETMRATFSAEQVALIERAIELVLGPAGATGRTNDAVRMRTAFLWSERAHVPRLGFGFVNGDGEAHAHRLLDAIAEGRAALERQDARLPGTTRADAAARHRRKLTVHRLQRSIEQLEIAGARTLVRRSLTARDVLKLQRRLAPDELLLEYFVGGASVHAFAVTRAALLHVRLPVREEELRSRVFRLRRLWDRFALLADAPGRHRAPLEATERDLLAQLEGDLLGPVLDRVGSVPIGRMTVVPHSWLRDVPFHALGSGTPLAARVRVGYLMSARERLASRATPVQRGSEDSMPTNGSRGPALAVGVATPEAPSAEIEAREVAALYPGAEVLAGSDATPEAVRSRWSRASHIHVAGHATREVDEPRLSGIRLESGSWTALDISRLEVRADLVVLSGCATGDSVVWGGDEAFGLLPALTERGARAVLVSLWPVGDAITREWMKLFHGALTGGETIAEAWRSAGARVRAAGGPAYQWAPFALYGRHVFERSAL